MRGSDSTCARRRQRRGRAEAACVATMEERSHTRVRSGSLRPSIVLKTTLDVCHAREEICRRWSSKPEMELTAVLGWAFIAFKRGSRGCAAARSYQIRAWDALSPCGGGDSVERRWTPPPHVVVLHRTAGAVGKTVRLPSDHMRMAKMEPRCF